MLPRAVDADVDVVARAAHDSLCGVGRAVAAAVFN